MMSETKTVREIMDPTHRLPEITLVDQSPQGVKQSTLKQTKYGIFSKDKQIGFARLYENVNEGRGINEAWFSGVEISDPDLRGRGYGLATYLAAIEHAHAKGETFRTHDWSQTGEAVKVWTKFIDAGIAEVIEPFEEIIHKTDDGPISRFTGHVVIPPQSHT